MTEKLNLGDLLVSATDHEAYIQLEDLSDGYASRVRAGEWDNVMGVQLLAAHRLATLEEAAKIAQRWEDFDWSGADRETAQVVSAQIATSIRNLGANP